MSKTSIIHKDIQKTEAPTKTETPISHNVVAGSKKIRKEEKLKECLERYDQTPTTKEEGQKLINQCKGMRSANLARETEGKTYSLSDYNNLGHYQDDAANNRNFASLWVQNMP